MASQVRYRVGNGGYSPQEASHDMFEKPCGLLLYKLGNHVAQDRPDGVEALVCSADIV